MTVAPVKNRGLLAILGIGLLAIAPFAVGPYPLYIISTWLIMSIAVLGLNIPLGLGAIYSFGQGAFVLIGAYGTGVAMANWGWDFFPAMLFSILLAVATGALIGLPSLRLMAFSLAIVTISFAFMLFHLVKAFELTGGPQGIFMPHQTIITGPVLYYVTLAAFCLALFMFRSIAGSKTGRALNVIGENEVVARTLGINLLVHKVAAFMMSAGFGALAGSLLAMETGYVGPESYSPELSVNLFAALIIGGVGTTLGPLLGALFVVLIPELTQSIQNISQIVYAVLFCAAVTLFPGGLVGLIRDRAQKRDSR